jgi:predicted dehydrogenase
VKHKVVVIGAGYFGERHIKALSQIEEVNIIGIAEKDTERGRAIAESFNIKHAEDFREFLEEATTFFIVTPTKTHFEITMELIQAGKNIFIEKPITENPIQAKILIDEAIKRGIIFQIGLIERFNPVIETLFGLLKNPKFIVARRVSPFLGRATDTHVTFDLMIHDLDLIFYLLKETNETPEVKEIKSFNNSIVTDKIDFSQVWIDFSIKEKTIGTNLTASRVANGFERRLSIMDEDSALYADLIGKTIVKIDQKGNSIEIAVKNKEKQPLQEEIKDFLQSIKEQRLSYIAPKPDEIVRTIEIINKINGGKIDEAIH